MPLAAGVDLDTIAGEDGRSWSARSLQNLVNEAALQAARKGQDAVGAR